jgi:hypothetical protein
MAGQRTHRGAGLKGFDVLFDALFNALFEEDNTGTVEEYIVPRQLWLVGKVCSAASAQTCSVGDHFWC